MVSSTEGFYVGRPQLGKHVDNLPRLLKEWLERWSRPGCPELVAGSGKQVEVVMNHDSGLRRTGCV